MEAAGETNYFILKLAATSSILTPDWSPSYLKVKRRPLAATQTSARDTWSFGGRLAVPVDNPLFTGATNPFKFLVLLLDRNNVDFYSSVSFPPGSCVGRTKRGSGTSRGRIVCTSTTANGTEAKLSLVQVKGGRGSKTPFSQRVYKVSGQVKRGSVFPIPSTATLQIVLDFSTAVYWQPRPFLPCKHSKRGDRVKCG